MKKRSILLLLMIVTLVLPLTVASAASYHYVSGTSSLKLREKPDASATVIGSYRKDYAVVSYKKYDSNWAYISFSDGTSGYVKSKYLKAGSTYTAYVKKDDTSLRSGPADSFSETATLLQGAKVKVYTSGAVWCYVSSDNGTGYIRKSRLSTSKVAKSENAGTPYTAYVTNPKGNAVNVRSGAGKGYSVKGKLPPGSEVTVQEISGKWSRISGSLSGWIMSQYLSKTASKSSSESSSSSSSTGTTRFVVSPDGKKVNLRHGPNEKTYAVKVRMDSGSKVTVLARENGWSKVQYGVWTGYVKNEYLVTKKPSGTSSAAATTTTTKSTGKTKYIVSPNGKKVNLRHGPSVKGYGVKVRMDPGSEVTVYSSENGWSKVKYGVWTGYVKNEYLSSKKPSESSSTTTTTTTTTTKSDFKSFTGTVYSENGKKVNMRRGPGRGYATVTQIESGSSVTVTGESGKWYKISYNGSTGYMSKDYIKK